jgi:nucleoside-diphosphate-sugar epimerase
MQCLVAGAGGFIGGHLVVRLLRQGHTVRAVDIKPKSKWWQTHKDAQNWFNCDVSLRQEAFDACDNMDRVFNLACDMGGIDYIENNKADCMLSVLINTHLLMGAKEWDARYFYSSSACVYHAAYQSEGSLSFALAEEHDTFMGGYAPEDGYGWEKLFSEMMCRHFHEDFGMQTRIARFHNIYGPHGSWNDGREKAPAALCRKVAEAKLLGHESIPVWGDGSCVRSFCYIDDCVEGIIQLMESDCTEPINIGSSESVSVGGLLTIIEHIAGILVERKWDTTQSQGVAGRNSDNTLCKEVLGWEPTTSLIDGLRKTYPWIEEQVNVSN